MRFVAFAFLVAAAFAWTPPFVDRAGTAALGFAFVALIVGRGRATTRPSTLEYVRQLIGPPAPTIEPVVRDTGELLAAYLSGGGSGSEDRPGES